MLDIQTGFFAWPLADGLARGLARYRERYAGDPPAIWLRVPPVEQLQQIPVRADSSVPADAIYYGPVPLRTAIATPNPAGYEQEMLTL